MLLMLVSISALAGLAEAAVLVATVRVALALTGESSDGVTLPFADAEISNGALVGLAASFALVTLVMHLVEARLTARLVSSAVTNARAITVELFMNASWQHQSLEREGALQETSTVLTGRAAIVMLTIAQMCAAVVNLTALLVVALFIDPFATLAVVGFGALLFAALRPVARLTQQRAGEWVAANSEYAEEITGVSALALELRVFGRQRDAERRLSRVNEVAAEANRRMRIASSFGSSLYRDVALLALVGAVAALYFFVDAALASVGTVALLVLRSIAAAQRLQSTMQAAHEQHPGLVSLQSRLDKLREAASPPRSRRLDNIGEIALRNVSYQYPGPIGGIADIHLTIHPGESIGIVGPSGGGKSTLAQVVLRLRPPTSGLVLVNGHDYQLFDDQDWADRTAFVPQEPRLLEATVADNIRFFRSDFTDAEIRAAADAAHILGEIDAVPSGFKMMIGPRGAGLSGGQRQRLTIARALLGSPELLVLDEPTSALDVESERLLSQTVSDLRGRTTLVIIAHRLSTVESCDRIVVMRDGRIEQVGTPAELLERSGFYRTIAHEQT